jgi:hypothetical protein
MEILLLHERLSIFSILLANGRGFSIRLWREKQGAL